MKKIVQLSSLMLASIILLTGCGNSGKVTNRKGPQGETEYRYSITIEKSEENTETIEILHAEKEMSVKELLDLSEREYDARLSENTHLMFELDGVVATARHGWFLFIDDELTQTNLDTYMIKPKNDVEWRYDLLSKNTDEQ